MRKLVSTPFLAFALAATTVPGSDLQAQLFPRLGTKAKVDPMPHVTWTVSARPADVSQGGLTEVVAAFETAPGWHLYSPDFKGTGVPTGLTVDSPHVKADGALKFPTPVEKKLQDEIQRILEGKGEVRLPVKIAAGAPIGDLAVTAKVRFQTCDATSCDFPSDKDFLLTIRVVPAPPPAGALTSVTKTHVKWTFEAPRQLAPGGKGELKLTFELAKGWHLYSPDHTSNHGLGIATRISIETPGVEPKDKPSFPKPHEVNNENTLGETFRLLEGKGEIRQPFTLSKDAKAGDLPLGVKVDFMTCDAQTCDPPEVARAMLIVRVADEAVGAPGGAEKRGEGNGAEEVSLWAWILLAIGGGLLALIMPCTYPMIPITISFFTKQAEARGGKVLGLAIAYGAGIVLVFNVVGWAFAGSINKFANDPWLNLCFGLLFVVFALSLFGLYELRLPRAFNLLASRAAGAGGFLGVFVLGTTLVITSFTCTAPIMGSILTAAAAGGALGRVTIGMTVFGLTMAAPFVALALFPSKARSLPRAGEWMHTIKVFLGFIEIAAAFKFFSTTDLAWQLKMLPRELFLSVCGMTIIAAALYLFGVIRMKEETAGGISSLRLVLALVVWLFGTYLLLGALGFKLDRITESLGPDYSAERLGAAAGAKGAPGGSHVPRASWSIVEDDYEAGLRKAREEKKLAFVNFTGVT